jgi:hypothetical protein
LAVTDAAALTVWPKRPAGPSVVTTVTAAAVRSPVEEHHGHDARDVVNRSRDTSVHTVYTSVRIGKRGWPWHRTLEQPTSGSVQ